jgi:glycosyltransferase involved in cell wall biosynthesis
VALRAESPGETRPLVSFGLPVWNSADTIRRSVDSVLAQELRDFEVVVSDNASTDGTFEILHGYAAAEPRLRLFRNPENLGQIENFNRVLALARGRYFRWIGADDWLEPAYAARCAELLEREPDAVAATTWFRVHADDGREMYEEYAGEKPDSADPARRLARMLRLFHAGYTKYDPVYSLIRRDALERTGRMRNMQQADWMLAAELALLGRFVHVPACLAHRSWSPQLLADHDALMERYHPKRKHEIASTPGRLLRELRAIFRAAPLTSLQRARCAAAAWLLFLRETRYRNRYPVRTFLRRRGLTRARLSSFFPSLR